MVLVCATARSLEPQSSRWLLVKRQYYHYRSVTTPTIACSQISTAPSRPWGSASRPKKDVYRMLPFHRGCRSEISHTILRFATKSSGLEPSVNSIEITYNVLVFHGMQRSDTTARKAITIWAQVPVDARTALYFVYGEPSSHYVCSSTWVNGVATARW